MDFVIVKEVLFFLLGFIILVKCADYFVESAVSIARYFHISEIVIGGTLVAIATTMPEFVTTILATIKDHPGIAYGNVIGSCICNIGLILGVGWLLRRNIVLPDTEAYFRKSLFMFSAIIVIFISAFVTNRLNYITGIILLVLLGVYVIYTYRTREGKICLLYTSPSPRD